LLLKLAFLRRLLSGSPRLTDTCKPQDASAYDGMVPLIRKRKTKRIALSVFHSTPIALLLLL
jgi:hypothetical protein